MKQSNVVLSKQKAENNQDKGGKDQKPTQPPQGQQPNQTPPNNNGGQNPNQQNPNNQNPNLNPNVQRQGQAQAQPRKRSLLSRVLLWVLIILGFILLFSIIFSTPTYIISPEVFLSFIQGSPNAISINGNALTISNLASNATDQLTYFYTQTDSTGTTDQFVFHATFLIDGRNYQYNFVVQFHTSNPDASIDAFMYDTGSSVWGSMWEPGNGTSLVDYMAQQTDGVVLGGIQNLGNQGTSQPGFFWSLFWGMLPWVIFFMLGWWLISMMMRSQQNAAGFGKMPIKMENPNTKFSDVAGYDEVKRELVELVEYLKNPLRFSEMGARAPKGVLLAGAPGTGKTLFARAIAGEAGIPFFSISGSDFVEMFVGVGASRVRNMFANAKKVAPALLFIDEMDAVGRMRGAGVGGGNDEREQTLNQLLVEMDGFTDNSGIIILAATNRPDVLDPALRRPGRFDREVVLRLPDVKERAAILRVHARSKKLAQEVDLDNIATRTPGFSGAQLENVLNESAILAVRERTPYITPKQIDEGIDRVIGGPAKTNNIISMDEKRLIAYHEAGHAVIGLKISGGQVVQKITIIPRGDAGGYVLMTPKVEKFVMSRSELIASITSFMGGRASEEIHFGKVDITTGASDDIAKATQMARRMVTEFGMSSMGPIQYEQREGSAFLGRELASTKHYSQETNHDIDKEVRKIIDEAYTSAMSILKKFKPLIKTIAETLIRQETITAEEIEYIHRFGKLPEIKVAKATTKKAEPKANVPDIKVGSDSLNQSEINIDLSDIVTTSTIPEATKPKAKPTTSTTTKKATSKDTTSSKAKPKPTTKSQTDKDKK